MQITGALICSKLLPPNDSAFGCLAVNNKTQETSKIPLAESTLFQGIKTPPYIVVRHSSASTIYGGQESRFGFAAVFRTENKEGSISAISVGYKGEFADT